MSGRGRYGLFSIKIDGTEVLSLSLGCNNGVDSIKLTIPSAVGTIITLQSANADKAITFTPGPLSMGAGESNVFFIVATWP